MAIESYISTDPYAGDALTGGGVAMPPGPHGPNDGYYDDQGNWIPYGSEGPGGFTGQGVPGAPQTGSLAGGYDGGASDVDAWLAWMAKQPGHDPILDTPQGQAYYKQRINETGGLSASNQAYWQNKATLGANGGAVGVPEGGAGNGNLWNTLPTLDELQNMPGYQAMLKAGKDTIQGSAAAKGTLLTGGTLKDLNDYAQGTAAQQYLNLAGLKLGYNQSNFNNLYNLAGFGLSGSATGGA